MKISLPFELRNDARLILLRAGYHEHRDINAEQRSYIRRLSGDFYPRFHVYMEERDGRAYLNLHLDQKKPSYPGAHAHNADYDGDNVEREAARIQGFIAQRQAVPPSQQQTESTSWWSKIFH